MARKASAILWLDIRSSAKDVLVLYPPTGKKLMKVEHRGYRIWAILQANGKYRAYFVKSLTAAGRKADVSSPLIEAETENEAIAKVIEFIDGRSELTRPR